MNTQNQQSQSELPSPIIDTSQKKSKSSIQKQLIQNLDDSQSISQKDDNELLQNLSKMQEKKDHSIAQSLHIQREWHPADYKSDIFEDNVRNDNINQSTQIDIEIKQSGKDRNTHKKQNPLDQPIINELEDSIYIEQTQLKQSKILRKSLSRIKQNKDRNWIEPNFDIFDDPEIDELPNVVKIQNRQRKNSITVNYIDRKNEEKPNNQLQNNPPPGLAGVLINMMNSVRGDTRSNQQFQPNINLLHPQMNLNPSNQIHSNFQPNPGHPPRQDNFPNPISRTQHQYGQFSQSNYQTNPPTPRSQTGWGHHQPQNTPQSMYQNHHFSGYEIMNEIKFLREDVRMLREQWKEEKAEKLIQKLQQKLRSQSRQISRQKKGSDSYEKSPMLSFEVNNLLQDQERRHEKRMREIQSVLMGKIFQLQREQKHLKEQNSILRKRSMFKHTDSHELTLTIPEFGIKSGRSSRKGSKKRFQPQSSVKQNIQDNFLKDKLSIIRGQSPLKMEAHKRKVTKPKSNKNVKKDQFNPY